MNTRKHVFSTLEKKVFVEILKKYTLIIENKGTDNVRVRAKNKAWDRITKEFNSSPHASMQFTAKQLRRLWMNLKQRQKEAIRKRLNCPANGGTASRIDLGIDPVVSQVTPGLLVSMDDFMDETSESAPDFQVIEVSKIKSLSEDPSTDANETPRFHLTASPPAPSKLTPSPPLASFMKDDIIAKEYRDKERRAEELHKLELELMRHRVREAKAKADLAEYVLQEKLSASAMRDEVDFD